MTHARDSELSEAWPFDDPVNVAVITTTSVLRDGRPVLLVMRDERDGQWQFLDGGEPRIEDAKLVSLYFMTTLDPTVIELANLPCGWIARRESSTDPWHRQMHP
jgi:hypothetical protein